MAHSRTYEAIVLRTYDVGEADRFCVLLTRERGKLAARARGARKLTSRIGGSLLPLCRTAIGLHEGRSGFLITGTHDVRSSALCTMEGFLQAQQGIELLIQLLEDEDAVPGLFDLAEEFLERCRGEPSAMLLPFTVRLLFLLGLLPHVPATSVAKEEVEQIAAYLRVCTTGEWQLVPNVSVQSKRRIQNACNEIIMQHARSALRAGVVAGSISGARSGA